MTRVSAALAGVLVLLTGSAASAQTAPSTSPEVRTEPGAAAVPSAPASVADGTGAALATWAALALSGVAVLLGGAGLGVGLAARRSAAAAEADRRRPVAAPDPRPSDRLDRLEAQVRELAAAASRRSATGSGAAPAAADVFPPGSAQARAPAAPASTSSASPPAPAPGPTELRTPAVADGAEELPAWTEALRDDFARFARDPASAAVDFLARRRPRGAALGPEGAALLDGFEGAKLWAVRAPGDAEVWALVPGEQAVLDWSAHFAPQRAEVAADVFGPAFDLVADGAGALRLEAVALVRRDASGRLSVRRRGRLAGFRS